MEIAITKILDGIFIGDHYVPTDLDFIFGNKVSHVVGWTIHPLHPNLQSEGIHHLLLPKTNQPSSYPSYIEICGVVRFIEYCQEEYLCALIYSQTQSHAALILIPYLMIKYKWNLNSSFNFIMRKIDIQETAQKLWDKLNEMEQIIQKNNGKLVEIQWTYQYLNNYQSFNEDEMVLIHTLKNSLPIPYQTLQTNKKNKKIQWFDKVKSNVLEKSRVINYQRPTSSLKKDQKQFVTKFFNKKPQSPKPNPRIHRKYKKSILPRSFKEQVDLEFMDDGQFIPLKQFFSSNYLDQVNNRSNKVLKKSLIKQSKSQKSLDKNGHSAKKPFLYLNTINPKEFINNLKLMAKSPNNYLHA